MRAKARSEGAKRPAADEEQHKRFAIAARELGCEENGDVRACPRSHLAAAEAGRARAATSGPAGTEGQQTESEKLNICCP
jgi:hypothetical protein